MKSKKLKILTPILSVGALSAILIPTISLTSCSATATPYIKNFVSENSSIIYSSQNSSNGVKETINFSTELDQAGNMFKQKLNIGSSTNTIDVSSFDKEWEEITKKDPNLSKYDSILKLDKEIITTPEIRTALKNKNILTLFTSVVSNLKSVYTNYDSLFINKNPEITSLIKKPFVKFLATGLSKDKSYARLWLSDISFDAEISINDEKIGTELTESDIKNLPPIIVKIKNIKLKYEWFWLNNDGSTKVQPSELKDLQNLASNETDKPKKLTYVFTSELVTDFYFKQAFNTINNKNYKTGLIFPDSNKPLAFNFRNESGQEEQNREKTHFFNEEVLKLIQTKIIDNKHFNDLYAKVGYLTINNLPNNNVFSDNVLSSTENIKKGKQFIEKIFDTKPVNNPNANN